jgi:leucyl-tRNA synthetase
VVRATSSNGICVNSGCYDGLAYKAAVEQDRRRLLAAQGLGEKKTTWRLRDWGISRQRYWGTPIPIIHCDDLRPGAGAREGPAGGAARRPGARRQRQPAEQARGLPGRAACPKCGKPARRETDTMDTFVDSSWYYMRYCSPDNDTSDGRRAHDYWMPMDQYIGGIEHAVLHLLYARFWTKVMRDLQPERGLVTSTSPSPACCQGMVLNHIYSRKTDKGGIEYFWPTRWRDVHDDTGQVTGAKLKGPTAAASTTAAWARCPSPRTTASTRRR